MANMQCYTIRNMNSEQFTKDDMEQHNLVNVQKQPLDNRHKFLDVMSFPTLFPDGHFGEYHQRTVSTSSLASLTKTPVSGKTIAVFYLL